MNQKHYKLIVIGTILFSLFMVYPVTMPISAADGAAGSLVANVDFIVAGMPVTLRAYDLTAGADYNLNHTNDATGYDFVAAADGDWQITIPNVVKPSGSSQVSFTLRGQAAGALLSTASVTIFNLQDFLVTGLIVVMGVFILMIVIIKRVVKKG